MRPVDNADAVKVVQGQSQLGEVKLDILLSEHHLLQQRWNSWTSILKKRLESFSPCYSQSILLADFKENHTLLWL